VSAFGVASSRHVMLGRSYVPVVWETPRWRGVSWQRMLMLPNAFDCVCRRGRWLLSVSVRVCVLCELTCVSHAQHSNALRVLMCVCSRFLFSWATPLFREGNRRPLRVEDLWELRSVCRAVARRPASCRRVRVLACCRLAGFLACMHAIAAARRMQGQRVGACLQDRTGSRVDR
jgi:hypothetical protein